MSGDIDQKNNNIFGMTKAQWKEFQFIEHQLGVVDTKANNVLMVDSVLIVITTLTSLFQNDIDINLKYLSEAATACVLISVGLCICTIWIKWATDYSDAKKLIELRNRKTRFLNSSLIVLAVGLILYLAILFISI
jgi:hypothetical protein